jgi:arsenate reductase
MIKMYGIPNCDIIKKAMKFFALHKVPFEFYDFKKEGVSAGKLKEWCSKVGWQTIFNKRSTTWKETMKAYEGIVNNQAEAIQIMQQHTSIIKRPVIEINGDIIVGYDEAVYKTHFLTKFK